MAGKDQPRTAGIAWPLRLLQGVVVGIVIGELTLAAFGTGYGHSPPER